MDDIKKARYDFIDILKVIAIVMAIILHTVQLKYDFISTQNVESLIHFFVRMSIECVPIFICINGFLIINKRFDLNKHLRKILKIFSILIIWCVIDIILIQLIKNEQVTFNSLISNVLLTNISNPYTGPLWFLQSLIMLYLMFPVLKVVHDNNKKVYNYFFVIVSIFTIGLNLANNLLTIIQSTVDTDIQKYFSTFMGKYNPVANGNYIFFFMLGGYIFEHKEKLAIKKVRSTAVIVGVISLIMAFISGIVLSKISNKNVADSFNYSTIFTAFMIIALFASLYNYQNKNRIFDKVIIDIGKNSLGIYLVHKVIIAVIDKCFGVNRDGILSICVPVLVLAFSYLIVKIIKRIPKVCKIVEI